MSTVHAEGGWGSSGWTQLSCGFCGGRCSAEGSGVLVMFSVVSTTLGRSLWSMAVLLPYHSDTFGQDAFNNAAVEVAEDLTCQTSSASSENTAAVGPS